MKQHQQPIYLSTTIPYVNAAPHVGFALELVQTDAFARYLELIGKPVRTSTGTDDHSLKNVRAALNAGVPVTELVARNASAFSDLCQSLGTTFDETIWTSRDARHADSVTWLFRACQARGDLYRRAYRGLYCVGCEQFYAPSELVGQSCPEHERPLELIEEENWFFRLSRYQEPLERAIANDTIRILPEERKREALAFIGAGLEDFSVSRSSERAHGFGIPVPDDPTQVIYVWFDALANYLTAGSSDVLAPAHAWQAARRRIHVLGKGVLRFHAVYWPALLLSAGLAVPEELRVHGYLTLEGKKIGKSTRNGVSPSELLDAYGQTALRYYLLRHVPALKDADFSRERLIAAHDSELADELGNLALRVLSLVARHRERRVPAPGEIGPHEEELNRVAAGLGPTLATCFDQHDFSTGLARVFELVRAANRYLDRTEPWQLAKRAQSDGAADQRLSTVLASSIATLRVLALTLYPFLPLLAKQLGSAVGQRLDPGSLVNTSLFHELSVGYELAPPEPLVPRLRPRTNA